MPAQKPIFRGSGWSSDFYAEVVLGAFAQSQPWSSQQIANALQGVFTTGFPPLKKELDAEFEELIGVMEYRAGVLDEALGQRDTFLPYFQGVLSFNATTHPYTTGMFRIAELVGLFVSMHYKAYFNRVRPSVLCPSLMPPVDVPGHAAFPSGHATQAYLTAFCLKDVLPEEAVHSYKQGKAVLAPGGLPTGPLFRLAERIARNREVLGLHYPSDSRAGRTLAAKLTPMVADTLNSFANGGSFGKLGAPLPAFDLLAAAKAEWS